MLDAWGVRVYTPLKVAYDDAVEAGTASCDIEAWVVARRGLS